MSTRASLLRAMLLAAVAVPAAGCGGETYSSTGETGAGQGGAGGSGGSGQGGAGAGQGGAGTAGAPVGGASGQGGAGPTAKWPCQDPTPVLVDGKPTGYEECADGTRRRRSVVECPSLVPRPGQCPQTFEGGGCKQDADCQEQPNGHCEVSSHFGGDVAGCSCTYGCTRDSDCGAGAICECGDPVGRCVASTCTSDEGCAAGDCVNYGINQPCYTYGYSCQTPADTCRSTTDCGGKAGELCLPEGEARICKQEQPCAIGRPLVVEEGWRFAALVAGAAGWG